MVLQLRWRTCTCTHTHKKPLEPVGLSESDASIKESVYNFGWCNNNGEMVEMMKKMRKSENSKNFKNFRKIGQNRSKSVKIGQNRPKNAKN